jgi:Gylcosyl hydrolase family 115 C-terminal domain
LSPNNVKLVTADAGTAHTDAPLASPSDYIDVTFNAQSSTPYTVWLRLQALNDNKYNDSVWVQFSDARLNGSPIYPLNSTSALLVNLATDAGAGSLNAWGWQNAAYWLSQPTTITFGNSGPHTMRIQIREDGVQLDQIVLSRGAYLQSAPGGPTNDATIVPKP